MIESIWWRQSLYTNRPWGLSPLNWLHTYFNEYVGIAHFLQQYLLCGTQYTVYPRYKFSVSIISWHSLLQAKLFQTIFKLVVLVPSLTSYKHVCVTVNTIPVDSVEAVHYILLNSHNSKYQCTEILTFIANKEWKLNDIGLRVREMTS